MRYTEKTETNQTEEPNLQDFFHVELNPTQLNTVSALGLAHVGDAVFEMLVRAWLCAGGKATNAGLHRATVRYVSAPAQAERVDRLLPLLSEEELAYYRRGRNAHVHGIPQHATHEQYAKATGLETLFGALYLTGRTGRISELFSRTMEAPDAV